MRVHELAKQLNIPAKELVALLLKDGVDVKSHMSAISEDTASKWLKKSAQQPANQPAEKKTKAKKQKPAKTKEKPSIETAQDIQPAEPPTDVVPDELYEDEEDIYAPKPRFKKKKKKFGKKKQQDKTNELPVKKTELSKDIYIGHEIQVKAFADLMSIPVGSLINKLIEMGMMVAQHQNIDRETAEIIGHDFGFEIHPEEKKEEHIAQKMSQDEDEAGVLEEKAPVVTFMGHVDHGKTSLLDYIRKSRVADGEAGKITQHIGAYELIFQGKRIVFLDTPGHKAFTAMRARGANATDIVVLVVAADDGLMEQTREAVSHARAADVPIIVAINKIDKNNANVDRVMRQLSEIDLMPEDWGGDTLCVKVSAMTGEGIEHLLELIQIQAEMMELKANPTGKCKGIVIESKMTRGRGPTVTVLIQRGTLKPGQAIFCDAYSGKVKSIINDKGENLMEAGPATPVEVLGLDGVPDAGSLLECVESEKEAKRIAQHRASELRKIALERSNKPTTLEELYEQIEADEIKELKIIIKGDVHGSIEALSQSLKDLSNEKVSVNVVHQAVGDISESDVMLATASDAIIIGFCIKVDKRAREISKKEGVQIKTYNVIYEAIDDVHMAMSGMLGTKQVEQVIGMAEIRETFSISRIGVIAGCYMKEGKALRNAKVRVLRDEEPIFEGELASLKRFKDEVKEVRTGMECGIKIDGFNDISVGDTLEFYILEQVAQTL